MKAIRHENQMESFGKPTAPLTDAGGSPAGSSHYQELTRFHEMFKITVGIVSAGILACAWCSASIASDTNRGVVKPQTSDSANDTEAETYLRQGVAKEEKGDLNGAHADYTKAIELKPDYAKAYHIRGIVTAQMAKRFQVAGELMRESGGSMRRRKLDYLDLAIADFTKAIDLKPDYAEAYNSRGVVKDEKGDFNGSIADCTKAIGLKPDYAAAYHNRALLKGKKGDFDGAIADSTEAIRLKPDNAGAYNIRALAKEEKGDLQGSKADLWRAQALQRK